MDQHQSEREIKHEQHVIAPELPKNPEALEVQKKQNARLIPMVVIGVALIFVIAALIVAL